MEDSIQPFLPEPQLNFKANHYARQLVRNFTGRGLLWMDERKDCQVSVKVAGVRLEFPQIVESTTLIVGSILEYEVAGFGR